MKITGKKAPTTLKKNRQKALTALAGSMKETWEDIDPLEYQYQLREERNLE